MKKKALVMTVPRSGTHFLLRFLVGVLGLDGDSSLATVSKETNCDFSHIHPTSAQMKRYKASEIFDACIITLRHPFKSGQSMKMVGEKIEYVRDYWDALLEEQKNYNKTLFLVIDGPEEERFPQLMAIAEYFGKEHLEDAIREYAEDWTPQNQSMTDEDREIMDFAVRAYEQWQS